MVYSQAVKQPLSCGLMKRKYLFLSLFILLTAWLPAWPQTTTSIQIKVNGLSDDLKAKVTDALLNRSKNLPRPPTVDNIARFYQQSPVFIRSTLQPYGYFKPQIRSQIQQVGSTWILTYTINSGLPIKIINVDIKLSGQGLQDKAFLNLLKKMPIKAGQILNVDNYQEAKNMLFNLASNRGYFDAKMITNQIVINIGYRQASIILLFDTGNRYRFGPTLFPASDLRMSLLQRYLRYQEGEYYNSAKIQKTQQVLANSGYFYQTVVTPLSSEASNQQVPIKIDLTPIKPRRYTFGLGYGTDTGPRGTFGFNWIPVNSYGDHVNVLARGSYLKSSDGIRRNNTVSTSYIMPGSDPATDSYAINAGYGDIDQVTGSARSIKTSFSYNTILGDDWQQVLALTYLNERYNLITPPTFSNANVVYPSGHWQYIQNRTIQKDKIINNGLSASFDVAGASEALLSSTNFLQGKSLFKALGTLEATHTRFLFRNQLGHTAIGNIQNLPLTLQLFAGGSSTIRGFKYNAIGPDKNLVIVSGEIQQRVYKDWYLAVFSDAGNLWGTEPHSSITNGFENDKEHIGSGIKVGAGFGVVVLTPIGAVEVGVARPVANGGKTWQFQFSVGAEL